MKREYIRRWRPQVVHFYLVFNSCLLLEKHRDPRSNPERGSQHAGLERDETRQKDMCKGSDVPLKWKNTSETYMKLNCGDLRKAADISGCKKCYKTFVSSGKIQGL